MVRCINGLWFGNTGGVALLMNPPGVLQVGQQGGQLQLLGASSCDAKSTVESMMGSGELPALALAPEWQAKLPSWHPLHRARRDVLF